MQLLQKLKTITASCLLITSLLSGHILANDKYTDKKKAPVVKPASIVVAKPKLSQPFLKSAKPLPKLTKARKAKMKRTGEKVPGDDLVHEVPNRNHPHAKRLLQQQKANRPDPVLQKSVTKHIATSAVPQVLSGFDGIGNVQGAVPPDTNADVGPNHIVQMVNTAVAIWDKQGEQLLEPVAINTLWEGFGGLCESTNRGDPIVLYDSVADRWLLSQFAFNDSFTDNHQCIAISQTGDPTGAYYLYDFLWSITKFNDYPHFGVWHNGYYAGINQFTGDNYSGAGVVVYERDKMLTGQTARQIIVDLEGITPDAFTPMPADIDGIYLPPSDMPEYFVSAGGAANTIDVWNFNLDWSEPDNASFTLKETLAVAAYNGGVCGFSRDCVVQPNSQKLDAIGQRMMFRLAYRNLNGNQHKLVANHTVVGSETDDNIAGVRWYEIDIDNATGDPSIANQGTFNPDDGNSRWMGSAAMDASGNIGVAYSVSGPTVAPSIRFSGRSQADPADQLTVAETVLKVGEGSQNGANRWGDYSSLSVDPVDDCTMWFTTEYYKSGDDNTTAWSTDIRSFKFDNCITGASGTISGTVLDSQSGNAIAGAEVSVGSFRTVTGQDGVYRLVLPVAQDYTVEFFKYGWESAQVADIDIAEDSDIQQDVSLQAASPVVVSGKVSDGSGLGIPLYSKITVNVPGATLTTFTNPTTGNYSVELFGGTLVKLTTDVKAQGYLNQSADINPSNSSTLNFALLVDQACTADGYLVDGFIESFESAFPPAGWEVDDIAGSSSVWTSTRETRGNLLATTGEAAMVDSDAAGQNVNTDSSLYTPILQVADLPSTTLEFDALYRELGDAFDLDILVGDGRWTNILAFAGTNKPEHHTIDLSSYLDGAQSFQLRWHYYKATWTWYALVDNVKFSGSQCLPDSGTFVQGIVLDGNTQTGLNNAKVAFGDLVVLTQATPDDDNLGDGYFRMFVPSSQTQEAEVSSANYQSQTVAIGNINIATPIELQAGKLEIAEELPVFELAQGITRTTTVTLTNSGNVDANVDLSLLAVPVDGKINLKATGPFHPSTRHFGPKALLEVDTKKIRYRSDFASRGISQSTAPLSGQFPIPLTFAFGMGINQDSSNYWIGDVKAGGAALDSIHQFNSDGVATRKIIDVTAISGDFAADIAYNNRTGMLWQAEVGNQNCIHEIDPVNLELTGNSICPEFGTSQRGLAYDPLTDTFYSGSWNDSIIHQFKTDGTIIRSVNVDLLVSGLAINPVSGSLFVLANDSEPAADIVVLDTKTSTLEPLTSMNFPKDTDLDDDGKADDSLADLTQAGLAIDCAGKLWTPSRDYSKAISIASGEIDICEWENLSWVELSSDASLVVAADSSVDVEITYRGQDLELGLYQAQLVIESDTPYGDKNTKISVQVVEPNLGKIQFTASNVNINEENDLVLTVERVEGSDLTASVDFTTQDGTAVAGENYELTEGTLTWEDLDIESKTITIPVKTVHQNKSFSVVLTANGNDNVLGTQTTVTVNVTDKAKGSGSSGWSFLLMLVALSFMVSTKKFQARLTQ